MSGETNKVAFEPKRPDGAPVSVVAGDMEVLVRPLFVPLVLIGLSAPSGLAQARTQEECTDDFRPLRDEAEKRGALIKAASARHAPPAEACKLIGAFEAAQVAMLKYVRAASGECAIPPNILDQLERGHQQTVALQERICASADPARNRLDRPQGNDFGDPAFKQRQ